ncbi:Ig-like domain-containing protein [Flavobacterium sp. P21]|uniref:HYR-like domain-containing protein n=1 Tax=Flavobacterium sp. P21 TaxID=3423948 RepID=UPI003D66BF9C
MRIAQAQFPTASDLCDADVSNITKVSGQFVASEGCGNSGTYTNTWTVKDDCGNTSDTFTQVITIEDKTAPTWNTVAGTLNVTLECGDTEGLAVAQAQFPTASDLCDADVSNITKVSGQFVATEGCGNSGTYTNTWTVKDDCGNTSDVFTQIITIEDTTAPTWTTQTASLNKTIECGDTEALASAQALFPTATDACDSDVTNIVKVSGQFIASEGCSNAGTYTNTWTIKDDCGNTSETFTQVITIQDTTKPVFNGELPSDITVSCDAVPEPANIQATDNCGGGDLPIVLSEVKSDIKNECGTEYTLTRKWTTSDCSGNTESFTQIITVRDTTPPTGTAPADVAGLQSTTEIPVGNPSDIIDEADNCEGNVTVTVSDSNNGASGCDGNAYVLTRTYTLTDCAGNKTELVQTFTVDNKVSVSGVPTNVSCLDGTDGSIAVTSSPGATVVITNANNEVVGNTNLPAGTYTLTATAPVNGEGQVCTATATVTITQPNYKVKISGQIINVDTNTPIANVPITLIPQGTTTGPILIRITNANGEYSFAGMVAGSYLVQVQDANLNSAYQLYPVDSSLFFTTLEECKFQVHDFLYGKSKLPVLGDYVWYDTNSNGIQDEWYDANNDGIVTKNIPDSDGAIDYSLWEWLDLNGDGSYTGPQNAGELNAGGFGNAKSANVIVDGPNGYHDEVIIGIQGFWRNRPESENPYGEYKVKLVRDANLDAVAVRFRSNWISESSSISKYS